MEESTSDSVHVMQSLMKAVIDLNDELADTARSGKISPELFCAQQGLVSDILAGEVKYILESQNIDCADLRRLDQYFVLGLLQQSTGKYAQAFETLEQLPEEYEGRNADMLLVLLRMAGKCLFEPEQAIAVQDKVLELPQEDSIKQIRGALVCILEIVREYHAAGNNLGKTFKALTPDHVDCLSSNFMGEERVQFLKLVLLC